MTPPTPQPPYTAVIFTSTRTEGDHGYAVMAARMDALADRWEVVALRELDGPLWRLECRRPAG